MIILGIDFGLKKIGLAYSDETALVAAPFKTKYIRSLDDALTFLIQLKQEIKFEKIVLGYPVSVINKETIIMKLIKKMQAELQEKINVPVELWDETYSTKTAEYQAQGRKRANADSEAARIILQEYLDYQNERRKHE